MALVSHKSCDLHKTSLDIEGTTVTFATGDASFADDAIGASAGLAAAINAAGITGITATSDGIDTVTITKTPTPSLSETASNQLTISSFDQLETLSGAIVKSGV